MGVFDIIELKNHVRACKEYVLYLDSLSGKDCLSCHNEFPQTLNLISEHLKNMENVLERMDK